LCNSVDKFTKMRLQTLLKNWQIEKNVLNELVVFKTLKVAKLLMNMRFIMEFVFKKVTLMKENSSQTRSQQSYSLNFGEKKLVVIYFKDK
jgi:hypothetical protein